MKPTKHIREIFDIQVNNGHNYFGPNSKLDNYLKESPENYTQLIVIPTATHILEFENKTKEISCLWEFDNRLRFYKRIIFSENEEGRIENPIAPYQAMNLATLNTIRQLNLLQKKKIYFCPKFHPHLDTIDDIEPFLNNPETVAVKIQGLASFSTPADVPLWFIHLLNKYNLPLYVHTHFYHKNLIEKNRSPFLHYIGNANQPLNWILFGLKHNIKILLAHGLRLCPYAAELVNRCDNFLVGLGPEHMLEIEQEMLYLNTKSYLDSLFQIVDPQKIAFCSDYAWNVPKRNTWSPRLWNTENKIVSCLKNRGLEQHLDSILYKNAVDFFGL